MVAPNDCECDKVYVWEDNVCQTCHFTCSQCESDSRYECTECAEGYVMQPGSKFCATQCPTGYTLENKNCVGAVIEAACGEFDSQLVDYTLNTSNPPTQITSVGGTSDPTPAYLRGMWYDGVNDESLVENMALHHTFTLSMWIRAEANGNLYSINKLSGVVPGDETVFNMIVQNGNLRVVYVGDEDSIDFVSTSQAYVAFDWHYVTVSVSFNNSEKESSLTMRSGDNVIGETTF